MLNQMCHTVLAAADISAIRKARGFKEKETASRAEFESFFLSSIGLDTVMASLTPEEVAALHLLSRQQDEADISFFERLYGSAKGSQKYYYGTFTQQYKDTFDAVKKSLLRKGVLVMAEAKLHGETVRMERWRFRFPPEFTRFLPPLILEPYLSGEPGEVRAEVARNKLLEVMGGPAVAPLTAKDRFAVQLLHGTLMMGRQPFSAGALAEWQQAAWQASLAIKMPNDPVTLSPVTTVQTILETLAPEAWVEPEQLEPALKVFCFGASLPAAEKICAAGWKWGCLARLVENGLTRYRLPPSGRAAPPTLDPVAYLQPHLSGESTLVDLRAIPFAALEQLTGLARLDVAYHNLVAHPDPIKLGRATPEARQSPLATWLHAHVPAFQLALDTVQERWGKIVVHNDLLVARVRDLSLRVQMERELDQRLVVLNDETVAFPRAWRAEVEKMVKKAGFVVKEVRA